MFLVYAKKTEHCVMSESRNKYKMLHFVRYLGARKLNLMPVAISYNNTS